MKKPVLSSTHRKTNDSFTKDNKAHQAAHPTSHPKKNKKQPKRFQSTLHKKQFSETTWPMLKTFDILKNKVTAKLQSEKRPLIWGKKAAFVDIDHIQDLFNTLFPAQSSEIDTSLSEKQKRGIEKEREHLKGFVIEVSYGFLNALYLIEKNKLMSNPTAEEMVKIGQFEDSLPNGSTEYLKLKAMSEVEATCCHKLLNIAKETLNTLILEYGEASKASSRLDILASFKERLKANFAETYASGNFPAPRGIVLKCIELILNCFNLTLYPNKPKQLLSFFNITARALTAYIPETESPTKTDRANNKDNEAKTNKTVTSLAPIQESDEEQSPEESNKPFSGI